MTTKSDHIPVYSLSAFSSSERKEQQFQIEVFDANRHFQVEYPHRHDFFEVLFLTKGSGQHVIDTNRYEIAPPCIFFMSPGQAHKLELSHDIEGYIFIFTADFYLLNQSNQNRLLEFPFFFTVKQTNPPLLLKRPENIQFFDHLFTKGIAELATKKEEATMLLRAILDTILVFSDMLYTSDEESLAKGKGHILVKQFLQLVETHNQENLSVNDYAQMLAITPSHLTQTVRQLTGNTSADIIHSKQIIEIKRLLIHTSLGVAEISNHMGFSDQSYFTKFFKKATGLTPLQFRMKAG